MKNTSQTFFSLSLIRLTTEVRSLHGEHRVMFSMSVFCVLRGEYSVHKSINHQNKLGDVLGASVQFFNQPVDAEQTIDKSHLILAQNRCWHANLSGADETHPLTYAVYLQACCDRK